MRQQRVQHCRASFCPLLLALTLALALPAAPARQAGQGAEQRRVALRLRRLLLVLLRCGCAGRQVRCGPADQERIQLDGLGQAGLLDCRAH